VKRRTRYVDESNRTDGFNVIHRARITSSQRILSLCKDVQLLVFPLLMIFLYEIFHAKMYIIMPEYQQYSWLYGYTLAAGALGFFLAGYISDKISRKLILCIFIPIALLEFALLVIGANLIAILISPLYASTPVAIAAVIDNHRKMNVKKLMCIAFAVLFAPWCFFTKISSVFLGWNEIAIIGLVLLAASCFFKDLKKESIENPKSHFSNKRKKSYVILNIVLLSIGLIGAETIFFQLVENAERFNYGFEFFEFINRSLICGAILCFFVTGNIRHLTFITYAFLLLLSYSSYLAYHYWGVDAWKLSFTYLGVLGGFYLPTVSEIFVSCLGRNARGKAIGLVLLVIDLASLIALLFLKKEQVPLYSLRIIILSAIITFISQGLYEHSSKDTY
jgi:MFS family permease